MGLSGQSEVRGWSSGGARRRCYRRTVVSRDEVCDDVGGDAIS